ncbi:MAG: hypothetical protein ACYCPP_05445, partial [Nitrososphaerales archaeon]
MSLDHRPRLRGIFGDLTLKYPTLFVARWLSGGCSSEVVEFFCGEPIVMRHLRSDLELLQRKGRIEISASTFSYHDLIIAAIKNSE